MRFLAAIGLLAILAALAGAVYFFGGFYNVAASSEDPGFVDWALVNVRKASIDRHARATPPIKLDDPQVIQAGARNFAELGCANCHGAPGVDWAKFSEGLNPGPPDLKDVAGFEPAKLFWVIKHGIRMTAMPSFAKIEVPDEKMWQLVAFIKKLPVPAEDYKAWTAAGAGGAPAPQH